jgi:hypothetical protein
MTQWNEQAAPDNNLKASDLKPKQSGQVKSTPRTIDVDQLNNIKIQQEIRDQNL